MFCYAVNRFFGEGQSPYEMEGGGGSRNRNSESYYQFNRFLYDYSKEVEEVAIPLSMICLVLGALLVMYGFIIGKKLQADRDAQEP